MSLYEIVIPGAAGMIAQERMCAPSTARHGRYVTDVSHEINWTYWLDECGGQHAVDVVLASMRQIATVPEYVEQALHAALAQVRVHRKESMADDISVFASFDRCPKHRTATQSLLQDVNRYPPGSRYCGQCAQEHGAHRYGIKCVF